MTDDTTPQQASTELDEGAIDNPLQRDGYVRVYRAVRDSTNLEAAYLYGVLEDYIQLSRRNRRPCVPLLADLASHMKTSERSVERHLAKLRDAGWLKTQKLTTGRLRYILTNPPAKNGDRPPANNGDSHPPKVAAAISNPDSANQNNPPISPTDQKQNGTQSSGTRNENSSVSIDLASYWSDPLRLETFEEVLGHYPNKVNRKQAMDAWREVIGTRLDGEGDAVADLYERLVIAAQWYARQMHGQETRYIKTLANWIRQDGWMDMPAEEMAK